MDEVEYGIYGGAGVPKYEVEFSEKQDLVCPHCGFTLKVKPLWQGREKLSSVAFNREDSDIVSEAITDIPVNKKSVKLDLPYKNGVESLKDERDKRGFKRSKKEAEIIVKVDTGEYKGRIIDYSDGICAIVKNAPLLVPGAVIDIKSHKPLMEFLGKVVWTNEAIEGLKMGVRRVGNLQGSLRDFRLPDILSGLQRNVNTGILEINDSQRLKKIYIKDGDVIFAASSETDDHLGKVLLNAGKITLEQYNRSLEISKETKKQQAAILVELGYLSPQELIWALKHQVNMIILSLFTVEDGNFEFQEGPFPPEEAIPLKVGVADLIYHGIKRINDLEHIKQECPPMDAVLSLSKGPVEISRELCLDNAGKMVLFYINGKNSIREILSSSLLNEFETFRTIYALLSIGAIEAARGGDKDSGKLFTEDVTSEPEIKVDAELIEKIEDMYNKYETLGYYGVLGINEGASEEEIKEAYYRAAKQFHPDMHFSLPSDIKKKLNTIFPYFTMAYETLLDSAKRMEHDESLSEPEKPVIKAEKAKAKFDQGRTELIMMRNFLKAESLFAQAIHLDNSIANYHYYHGLVLNMLERFKEAVKSISNAIKLNPQKANYIAELGHTFLHLGFKIRAKNTFEKALERSPSNRRAIEGMRKIENKKRQA